MPIVRAALLACAAAVTLSACAGLSAEAPGGVSLAGNWKVDHAASDDPQKTLALMRTQALKLIHRQAEYAAARPGTAAAASAQAEGVMDADAAHGGPRRDPLQHSPMARLIRLLIERGDYLTVHQSPTELVFDYGTSRRSFTPGNRSVVSAEGGVGDQTSGWHGGEYEIVIKAQNGPEVTVTYGLSKDGKHLVEKIHISANELPAVSLNRIYDPTNESAPRQLPTSD